MCLKLKLKTTENKKLLVPIIDSVTFCGCTNRNNDDDLKYHAAFDSYSTGGAGKFIDLLNYAVREGYKKIKYIYTSKRMRNKLIYLLLRCNHRECYI